jgi:hypothetical protein
MRRVDLSVGVFAMLTLAASAAQAQGRRTPDGFTPGYTDIGPVIGIGGLGEASVSVGARFEHGIERLPDLGDGVLSFAASIDHYSFNQFCPGCGYSYTPVGATINYHVRLDDRRWDPFLGIGLGDYFVASPANCPGCGSVSSGVYLIGRLGLRYFMQPNLAFYADVGSGAGALHLGVMFKLK